jgi:hypothetical protein
MTKLNRKYAETLVLLLVVAIAPVSIAFAQTTSAGEETTTNTNADKANIKAQTKANIRADIMTKLADKLEKRTENIKDKTRTTIDVLSKDNKRTDLTFSGQTDGWAIVGGVASKSSIKLAGNAHHTDAGKWKIDATGDLTVADRNAKLDLTGFVRGNKIHLEGSGTLGSGEPIRLVLNGNFAPTSDENMYAIAFTSTTVQYMNNGVRVPLMQVGSVTVADITVPVSVQP